jgi:hypothetical protein
MQIRILRGLLGHLKEPSTVQLALIQFHYSILSFTHLRMSLIHKGNFSQAQLQSLPNSTELLFVLFLPVF